MVKKSIPILEHFYKSSGMIIPEDFIRYQTQSKKITCPVSAPKYCIITSQQKIIEYCQKKYMAKKDVNWTSNRSELYIFNCGRCKVGIINVGIGAPQAAILFELLISSGAKEFFVIGSAGGLQTNLAIGDLVLVTRAIRDEGVSYHYLPPAKFVLPNKRLTESLGDFIYDDKRAYKSGSVWTTDAFFRESIKSVQKYRAEGVMAVDMKTAAIFAIAKYRKVNVCALFYVSDLLKKEKWHPRLYSVVARQMQYSVLDIVCSYIKSAYGGK